MLKTNRLKTLLAGCLFLLAGTAVQAATLHVSTSGSNDNPGTAEQPFGSIQHALDQAQPGDVIQIGPGIFNEQITAQARGTAEAPIIVQGTRGDHGEHLTQISPGKLVDPDTWQPAPEMGPNVYHNSSFEQQPRLLTIDGRFVAHVHRNAPTFRLESSHLYGMKPADVLASPDDHLVKTGDHDVQFWDVVYAVFMHHPDENDPSIYLRLPGNQNPRDHEFMASTGGAGITVNGGQHLVIRDLAISEGFIGIQVTGRDTRHITIERCFITHGLQRIHVTNYASNVIIRDNDLTMGFHGITPGAWAGGTTPEALRRRYQYYYFKNIHDQANISNDRAIQLEGHAHQILVENNRLNEGLIGIPAGPVQNVIIRNNTVHHFSSVGVVIRAGAINVHVVDNELYDNSINLRVHMLGADIAQEAYIRGNRFIQPEDVGQHIFSHVNWAIKKPYPQPKIVFYQNTFVGGDRVWWVPRVNEDLPNVPGFVFLNNVFSARTPIRGSRVFMQDPGALGLFDYNWIGGDFDTDNLPAWLGENNILAKDQVLTDLELPADHAARGAGIDLSKPFVINGRSYNPLPGLEDYYQPGKNPDIGAIQYPAP